MATSNFYNHPNGIFMIKELSLEDAYEIYLEDALNIGEEVQSYHEIDLEVLYSIVSMDFEITLENIRYTLENELPYDMSSEKINENEFRIYSKNNKVIAQLSIEGGYYSGAQIIVETDPYEIFGDYAYWDTKREMLEEFSPHNKRLFKYLETITYPLKVTASFSNGETIYEPA